MTQLQTMSSQLEGHLHPMMSQSTRLRPRCVCVCVCVSHVTLYVLISLISLTAHLVLLS